MQERLVLTKIRQKDEADEKRKEIQDKKAKKEKSILQKMEVIDREREKRRQQRVHRSLPDRGLSVMSLQSDRSDKEQLLESNPKLKSLHDKIMQKKSLRLAAKATPFHSLPKLPIDDVSRLQHGIDEIELAQVEYVPARREQQ